MKAMQNLELNTFKYRRINIPKANGKFRPLGITTLEWRLFQTLLNGILLHWLKHNITLLNTDSIQNWERIQPPVHGKK